MRADAVMTAPPARVAIAGTGGLAQQLLSRVLSANGATVAEVVDGELDVLVLVEPTTAHWDQAQELGAYVVLLTDPVPDGDALLRAIELGACAVLSTACERSELVDAVRRVASGDVALSRAQARQMCAALRQRPRSAPTERVRLTPREMQIVRSIEAGELIKQTARTLGISPRTVENTQRVLFRKLGVHSRAQAIARAYALGIVEPVAEVRV